MLLTSKLFPRGLALRPGGSGHVTLENQGVLRRFCNTRSIISEPLDLWLAAMSDAVPFVQKAFVLCPSYYSKESCAKLQNQCRQVLPEAQVQPLPFSSLSRILHSDQRKTIPASSPQIATLLQPFDRIAPRSQDIVVFSGNVLGQEMLEQIPSYISAAFRALRPSGVFAVLGHRLHVHVVSPKWAAEDSDYFFSNFQNELASLQGNMQNDRKKWESFNNGHQDIYFPFPAVKRRWFESEYRLSPVEFATFCRSLPGYSTCYGAQWRKRDFFTSHSSLGSDDFVDCSSLNSESELAVKFPLCVYRQFDPLDSMLQFWKHKYHISCDDAILRVNVLHFCITCSSRGMNVLDSISGHNQISDGEFKKA